MLLYGSLGATVATISVFLPSFLIVTGVTPLLRQVARVRDFSESRRGALCSFVGLLVPVTVRFATNVPWDLTRLLLTAGAFLALRLKVNILWAVLAGTVLSLLLF